MTAQGLFFHVFSEKDLHLNAVENWTCTKTLQKFQNIMTKMACVTGRVLFIYVLFQHDLTSVEIVDSSSVNKMY